MNRLLIVVALLGLTVSAFAANKPRCMNGWMPPASCTTPDAPPPHGTPNVKS